ncbi:MAG: AMP-binding protein [Candidatus Nanopelagicales bacterium]
MRSTGGLLERGLVVGDASGEVVAVWDAVAGAAMASPAVGSAAGERPADDVEVLARCLGSVEHELGRRMVAAAAAGSLPLVGQGAMLLGRGWSSGWARRLARCAALAARYPSLDAAWAAWVISSEHVDPLARRVDILTAEQLAGVVAELDPLWGQLSPPAVAGFVAAVLRMLHPPPDPDPEEVGAHEARALSFSVHGDTVLLAGSLPRVEGEAVIAAVEAFAERLRSTADHVPATARRADGLVALVNAAHAAGALPTRGGLPTCVSVSLAATATGDAVWTTSRGHWLTSAEGRFVACDAVVTPMLIEDPSACAQDSGSTSAATDRTGLPTAADRIAALAATQLRTQIPLAVGRSARTATPAQRRALATRDRGCVIPGCQIPPEACQTHHLHEWAAGGTTDTNNLVLLCWAHHRQVDLGMWTIHPRPPETGPAESEAIPGPEIDGAAQAQPDPPRPDPPRPDPPRPGAPWPGQPWPANNGAPFTLHDCRGPAGGCESGGSTRLGPRVGIRLAYYPVTAMRPDTPSPDQSGDRPLGGASARRCVGIEVPPGPPGLAALMPALRAALTGSGPAVALTPGTGSAEYRSRIAAAVQPGVDVPVGTAAVIATSGSTGDPAGVLLPRSALRAAAEGFTQLCASTARAGHRWVAALPLHHAGGFMVAVRAAVADTTPVGLASLGGAQPFSVAAFAEATERASAASSQDARPLAVSLVPPMLALLDDAGPIGRDLLAHYDAVLVGGAATPGPLVHRLRVAGVSVLRSYGMTETCGGVAFDGRPLPGISVRADQADRLLICGPQVAAGYRDGRDPDRWQATADGARCFRTSDLGQVGPDGLVSITGRVDDVVQVGGASVSLAAVREALLEDPRLSDAEVVAVAHRRFGVTIAAFAVPAGGPGSVGFATSEPAPGHPAAEHLADAVSRVALSPDGLADFVALRLGPAARPRLVRFVDGLPMLAAGKPDSRALRQLASDALEAGSGPTAHDRIRP